VWRAKPTTRSSAAFCLLLLSLSGAGVAEPLEIHYINVGQGGSTLIIGPDGTTILYDFGNIAGEKRIVPYLNTLSRVTPQRGIDFAIVSHADRDHFMGYGDVVARYPVRIANFEPGTDKTEGLFKARALEPSGKTPAGPFKPIPLGHPIELGDGARALVVAANARVWGENEPPADNTRRARAKRINENDRSIALFITYGKFQYLIDGDLGSGPESCTGHVTNQQAIQPRVARALLAHGLITAEHGVDVLHIGHHGSESSTSSGYYNIMRPEVGIISVGPKQGTFRHPRKRVVEGVLTCPTASGKFSADACEGDKETRPSCVTAPALRGLFQTDNGTDEAGCEPRTCLVSFVGWAAGNIQIATDGRVGYIVAADGAFTERGMHANVVTGKVTCKYSFDEDMALGALVPPSEPCP
jgi:beta-lactamase superfamily II metal-dependent hydrolase